MNGSILTDMQAIIAADMGNAFQVYADILALALPVLFTFGACSLLVNLVVNAAFRGKIKWFGGN